MSDTFEATGTAASDTISAPPAVDSGDAGQTSAAAASSSGSSSPDQASSADSSADSAIPAPATQISDQSGANSSWSDAHLDWVHQFCGVDLRSAGRPAGDAGSAVTDAAGPAAAPAIGANVAPAPGGGAATDAAGGLFGAASSLVGAVSGALSTAEEGAEKVVDAVTSGNPSLSDIGWMAAGGAAHIAAGLVPGGFLGAGAIDGLVAAKGSQEQKFWYGVGTTAAGVAETAVGGVAIAGGGLLAPETGGVTLAASAEGVNAVAAGVEAMGAGALLMAGGSGEGNGGMPGEATQATDRQRVAGIKEGFDNTKGHLQESDLNAARRELNGEVVARKADGTPWDHVHEVIDAQTGLYRRINDLKAIMRRYPPNSPEYAQMQELLSDMSLTLDKSREFVPSGSTSPLNPGVVAP